MFGFGNKVKTNNISYNMDLHATLQTSTVYTFTLLKLLKLTAASLRWYTLTHNIIINMLLCSLLRTVGSWLLNYGEGELQIG